jgi:hypothetical protein
MEKCIKSQRRQQRRFKQSMQFSGLFNSSNGTAYGEHGGDRVRGRDRKLQRRLASNRERDSEF